MKRLLFIGNSHLVAVKAAWEAVDPVGFHAEFFGAPQRAWAQMHLLSDNQFGLPADGEHKRQHDVTEQANGKTAVSLSNRDIIVIVGGFSAADPIATLLADCDVVGLRETGAATLLSDTLFAKACLAMAEAQLPEAGWHNRAEAVLLLPRPAPADTVLASSYPGYHLWHRLALAPDGLSDAFDLFDTILTAISADRSLIYVPQLKTTRTATGLTIGHLLAPGGGVQPGESHKRGDHAHMNPAYGATCVAEILNALQ